MSLQRLAEIAESVQQAGERSLDRLVQQLAELLALSRAEVREIAGPDPSHLQSVAVWNRDPDNYPEAGPEGLCSDVVEDGQIVRAQAGYLRTPLVGRTGRRLGWLELFAAGPLDLSRQPQLVARLFAPLAAAELERRQMSEAAGETPARELLAAAVHELRDPLSGVVNAADVLRETAGLDRQTAWASALVDRQSRLMVDLLEDLTVASDLSRGRLDLQFERLDLEPLIRQAIEAVHPQLSARRQHLRLETALDLLTVQGDRGLLLRALTRLLDQGARESAADGTITLSVGARSSWVVMNLAGPPAAPTRSSEHRLGATLAHRLITLHGGTVERDPGGPGRAPQLVLRLPAGPAAAAEAQPDATTPAAPGSRRVLVVDDEHDSASSLGMALQRRGHQVRIVHNGKAALEALPNFQPDAVLLDIGLPGLSGLEVARRIRALPAFQHLTLIAATGFGWTDDRRRSHQAGFDHHLVKPLVLEDVEAALTTPRSGAAAADPDRS